MRTLKLIAGLLLFCLLTILTQTGGIVFLLSLGPSCVLQRITGKKLHRGLLQTGSFLLIYSLATFVLVPPLAGQFGRVPLPMSKSGVLQPLNMLTFVLNRHYVQPALKHAAAEAAREQARRHPGTITCYLDAGFPFADGFPLLPHLSHDDGEKLDIAFRYTDRQTGMPVNGCPSFIGYGVCEEPRPGEVHTARRCAEAGYGQYSMLKAIVPQGDKSRFSLDSVRTRDLVNSFAAQPSIGRIFIEPHLKTRLGLTSPKIGFQGCQAVRHDDHIHVQLR